MQARKVWNVNSHSERQQGAMQGWNIAFKDTVPDLSGEEMEKRIKMKLGGDTWFLDGATWHGISTLPRPVRKIVDSERNILTVENPRFIHGTGLQAAKASVADTDISLSRKE
jgi:hypothetical protein